MPARRDPRPGPAARRSHHLVDRAQREAKAAKVVALLARRIDLAGARLLEVGTGSGWMAAGFADAVGPAGSVVSVDVRDLRETAAGFAFVPVSGTALPFGRDSFDVVVTNHVIEHVGERSDQRHHLQEIARVARPGAVVYLAVPNRWGPLEPHYRLPLLGPLPRPVADRYVRWSGRGDWYDVELLSRRALAALLAGAGLEAEDATLEALVAMGTIEGSRAGRVAARLPAPLLRALLPVMPTLIAVARVPAGAPTSPTSPTSPG